MALTQREHGEWLAARGRSGDADALLREAFERLQAAPCLARADAVGTGLAAVD